MPPVCGLCKEIGHATRRCPKAPKPCSVCNSTAHVSAKCPEAPKKEARGRKTRRSRSRIKQKWVGVENALSSEMPTVPTKQPQTEKPASAPSHLQPRLLSTDMVITKSTVMVSPHHSKLGNKSDMAAGESSGTVAQGRKQFQRSTSGASRSSHSDLQADLFDVESSDSELEEGEFSKHEPDFKVVHNRKHFSG